MKPYLLFLATVASSFSVLGQGNDKAKLIPLPKGEGYYYQTILKDNRMVEQAQSTTQPALRLVMDQSVHKLPNKTEHYKRVWANEPLSQGNTGTCWAFSTLSFYESEIMRQTGNKVKLSETYMAYFEYIEKARRFVQERGNSLFDEGSEANAVARMALKYGLVPADSYSGLTHGRKFHNHETMVAEMSAFLESLEKSNNWNEKAALETIAAILNHHLGVPPTTVSVGGKSMSPQSYMTDYLKLNPNDFIDLLSYKQKPFWQKVEYTVPDNWWHSADYYNVPLDVFMDALKKAIRGGYTVSIGGDTSEPGLLPSTQCAMVPDFDIPSAYISDDARAFRFANKTTTDDHLIHLVGYVEDFNGDDKDWYLIKDSGAGSRNNDEEASEFGYYFFHEDYVKLKMMSFTVHKDALKDILTKF